MRNRIAATVITSALLMSPIAGAQALTNGWNFIKAYNCGAGVLYGVNYLLIYPNTGGQLATIDPVTISLMAPLCTSGDGFFVYMNGTNWLGLSVYSGFK